jgi:phosphinothricin acetyltransferase
MVTGCEIRPARLEDLEAITAIYNEGIEDNIANCELGGYDSTERLAWFQSHDDRFPLWVAESGDLVAGWTCLSRYEPKPCFDHTAMFSTYVKRSHRGGGVGSQLRAHLIAEARRLGFHSIMNRVFARNAASIALARKHGFTEVARIPEIVHKDGEFWDCVFYQLLLSPVRSR